MGTGMQGRVVRTLDTVMRGLGHGDIRLSNVGLALGPLIL